MMIDAINELENEIRSHKEIQRFLKKLKDGEAKQEDVSLYGADLGECVSAVLNRIIRTDMPWDELNGIAMPMFKEVHQKVYEAASEIQKAEDEKNNIHMNPIRPEFPEGKIHDLIYKIYTEMQEKEDDIKS